MILIYTFLGAGIFLFVVDHFLKNILRSEGYQYFYLFGRFKNNQNLYELIKHEEKPAIVRKYSFILGLNIFAYLIFVISGINLIYHNI